MNQLQIVLTPLSEMRYGDSFQDEYSNTYRITDQEDEAGVEITFEAPGFASERKLPRFIGKITNSGTYRKFEQEQHRYFKENAWTINYPVLKRASLVEYHTDKRKYTISPEYAQKVGKKLTLNNEDKLVVPIKHWQVTSDDKGEQRLLDLLGTEWTDRLRDELGKDYMRQLSARLADEQRAGRPVYPVPAHFFRALKLATYSDVRVVIIGQDPYPQPYANGLAFAVDKLSLTLPYSLQQIQAEVEREITEQGFTPTNFDKSLESWASQGVLLLNANLSVGAKPGSHSNWGWELFVKRVMEELNRSPTPLVFMFWGRKSADAYAGLIDASYHKVMHAVHPAASAYQDYKGPGFVGCGHFGEANKFLQKTYHQKINW